MKGREPMSDLQAIADRVEIEAPCGRGPPGDEVRVTLMGERNRLVPPHQLGTIRSVEDQHLGSLDPLVEAELVERPHPVGHGQRS